MAVQLGTIKEFRGPFNSNTTINLQDSNTNNCIIGISVDEKDFMHWGSHFNSEIQKWQGEDIIFTINNEQIHLGRTCMYETEQQINHLELTFPYGAPPSLKVQVVYCVENDLREEEEE